MNHPNRVEIDFEESPRIEITPITMEQIAPPEIEKSFWQRLLG